MTTVSASLASMPVSNSKVLPAGSLTAITADETLVQTAATPYIITANGVVQAQRSQNSGGTLTFSGSGLGHNVGMSQYGASAMAQQGFSYLDILNFYYTGITVG